MAHYRKRPLRLAKRKLYTIANEHSASLLQWLQTYPNMVSKPGLWFANQKFSAQELSLCAAAGYPDVARALGWQPLEVLSKPLIVSITSFMPQQAEGKAA